MYIDKKDERPKSGQTKEIQRNKRSEAREEAFRIIFGLSFVIEIQSYENISNFAKELIEKTKENLKSIDEFIKNNLNKWKFERINKVDLALLRIAICEMLFLEDPTPKPVAISEALKFAKDYNGSETFINGILAKM